MNILIYMKWKMQALIQKTKISYKRHICRNSHRTLQNLATEVFKSFNRFSPPIMQDLFDRKSIQYYLRRNNLLKLHSTQTCQYYTQVLYFRGSLLLNKVLNEFKVLKNPQWIQGKISNLGTLLLAFAKFVNNAKIIFTIYAIFLYVYIVGIHQL